MELSTLLDKTDIRIVGLSGEATTAVTDCTGDSRAVREGMLFVAIPGTKQDGGAFVADAAARGACAIVSEKPQSPGVTLPWVQVQNARAALGLLAKTLHGAAVETIETIGVTGTNGKTTVAHLFKKLCEVRFSPRQVWMFGTISYQTGGETRPATHTTPESHELFRLIGHAAEKPRALVMEVSSHALALDRVAGMSYDVALLTNVTQDHLDFHKTMDDYYAAKKRLFTDLLKPDGTAVINIDDPWGMRLAGELAGRKVLTWGESPDAAVRIVGHECTWDGSTVELAWEGKKAAFYSPLRGRFNVANMTALFAGGRALGYSAADIEQALATVVTVPGRMERVPLTAPFSVIVDYAHTPDALVNILQTARPLTQGRLICVFGCGGDRDRTKRPIMGGAVAAWADEAIVTSDNPRSEKPEAIIGDIVRGIPLDFPHVIIPDRRSAIQKAIGLAGAGDCVVIAGKGHETYQEINGVQHPFSDRDIVIESYHA